MDLFPGTDTLFEHAACGLLVTTTDGIIRRVNTTFCKWLSYQALELLDKRRIQDLFTMGSRIFHHTHWAPLLQMQGSLAEVQMDLVCQDGTTIPAIINVIRRQHGDVFFDELAVFIATDRKQYERELLFARHTAENSLKELQSVQQKLQESRDVLGIAMRSAKMGVWSQHFSSNHYWLSRELETLLGIEEGNFSGTQQAFYNLVHEEDRGLVQRSINDALEKFTDYVVEFRLRHIDNFWIPVEGRGCVSYDKANNPQILLGVIIDITERRNTEARLRELNEKLSLADRRKDEFLATLAHELRNPLAPMRNVLEILKLKNLDDPQLLWARRVVERQVQQMTHLVDDLMEVSRITQGKVELRKRQVNIVQVIHSAVESARELIDSLTHQLVLQIPADIIFIEADETRLTQIVSNLLTNAAKYTPQGGRITLRLECDATQVTIAIRDSGIGIPAENLLTIFEMFSQLTPALERSQGGLGIGLALVRGLVDLHQGKITAHSEGLGKGSEFVVQLPVGHAQNICTESADSSTHLTSGQRILVVDDNIDAAESLSMALTMLGYETLTANDGLTCIQQAEKFRPQVILLDIGLPDISGYETAMRLRNQVWGKSIFLIAATGWGQDKDKERAIAAGFDQHLTKPIDFTELNNILSALQIR